MPSRMLRGSSAFLRWLSTDRRGSKRHPLPGLVAYYWTGGAPQAFHIADISTNGLYLLTDERWFPGTMILMTLQRTNTDGDDPDDFISVSDEGDSLGHRRSRAFLCAVEYRRFEQRRGATRNRRRQEGAASIYPARTAAFLNSSAEEMPLESLRIIRDASGRSGRQHSTARVRCAANGELLTNFRDNQEHFKFGNLTVTSAGSELPLLECPKNQLLPCESHVCRENNRELFEVTRLIDKSVNHHRIGRCVIGIQIRTNNIVRPWRLETRAACICRVSGARKRILQDPALFQSDMQVYRVCEASLPNRLKFRDTVHPATIPPQRRRTCHS